MARNPVRYRVQSQRLVRIYCATSEAASAWSTAFRTKFDALGINAIIGGTASNRAAERDQGDTVLVYTTDIIRDNTPRGLQESLEQDILAQDDLGGDPPPNRWWLAPLHPDRLAPGYRAYRLWHPLKQDQLLPAHQDESQNEMTQLAEAIEAHPSCRLPAEYCPLHTDHAPAPEQGGTLSRWLRRVFRDD